MSSKILSAKEIREILEKSKEEKSQMVKKLKFVKLANNWFVLLPDYKGKVEDLEMVCGADVLIEHLSKGEPIVKVLVSDEQLFSEDNYELNLVSVDGYGGTYKITLKDIVEEIWLCNVTKEVLGNFPGTIFFHVY
jgi:hypothetical protein